MDVLEPLRGGLCWIHVDNVVTLAVGAKDSEGSEGSRGFSRIQSSPMLFLYVHRNVGLMSKRLSWGCFVVLISGQDLNCVPELWHVGSRFAWTITSTCVYQTCTLYRGHTGVFNPIAHILLLKRHNPYGGGVICCQKHCCVNPVCIFFL